MEENYIHIFCVFLGLCLLNRKVEQRHVIFLVKEFYPVCDHISNRSDMTVFINKYLMEYPFLEELKEKLTDKNYIFNFQV